MTRAPSPVSPQRRWTRVLLLLLATFTLVACEGPGQEVAEEPAPDAEVSPEPTATPAPDAPPEDESTDEAEGVDGETTQLTVAYVPATTTLLAHIAQEQGFFDDEGLEVELQEASNISEIIPALGRQVDISLGTSTDLIRAVDAGIDVVQILGNTISTEDNPFALLIVGADSGISEITDLEGRRVASPTLSGVIHVATLFWAQQEGLDPASIEGVQVPPPNHPDQLQAGQVDAAEALEPFASRLLGAGNVSLGNPFAPIGLPLATNFWVANGEWAAANPDAVEGFARALEEAQRFLEEDEDTAREILEGYTELPTELAQQVALPTFELDVRVEDLGRWIDVLEELDELDTDVEPEAMVLEPTS